MKKCSRFVGLDDSKNSIDVAVAPEGRDGEVRSYGTIENTPEAVRKLVRRLGRPKDLYFVYEAGPCGYGTYRELLALGANCIVAAPSMTPRRSGERIKTDRRDALMLARLSRSGELTPVWVPDEEQEAIRDLTRAREDMKAIELKARQRLGAFLLRHDQIYSGKSRWTQAHFRWLETVVFSHRVQHLVLQEYIEVVKEAQSRVKGLELQMREALAGWSLGPVAQSLMALRGVSLITAMTILSELGDLSRFESPSQLMGYLGLVPSEHSSGGTRRQGAITKTGNGHVRRVLIESAWNYRYPARKTRVIERRAEKTSKRTQAIAWQAQKRLCGRYQALMQAGKQSKQVSTAVARELSGFIWAIACEAMGKAHASKALL